MAELLGRPCSACLMVVRPKQGQEAGGNLTHTPEHAQPKPQNGAPTEEGLIHQKGAEPVRNR